MATRPFSFSFPGIAGDKVFPIPVEPQGAIVCKVAGATVTGTYAGGLVTLAAALTVPATVSVTGVTYASPAKAQAPGTAITSLTQSTGGTVSNNLPAINTISSLTDNSGGTSGTNTVGAVTDIATAANAVATLAAKVTALAQSNTTVKNAVATLGAKQNETVAILKAAKIAT